MAASISMVVQTEEMIQMAASISMAGQKEVTTADWMVQTTATTMDDHSATTMDVHLAVTMAG